MPQKNLTNTIFYNVLIFSFIILFILILDLIYSNFFYQKSFRDLLQTNHSVYHHGFNKNIKVKVFGMEELLIYVLILLVQKKL